MNDGHEVHLPTPTVWPATIGAGIALAAFGVVTSYFYTALGAVLIIRGLAGWIEDMRHER
jgi:hypothetical protein